MFKLDCWNNKTTIDLSRNYGDVTVMAPARFDFIGGWTDTPPYHFDNVARVLNTPVVLSGGGEHQDGKKAIVIGVTSSDRLTVIENGKPVTNPENHLIISKTLEFLGLDRPCITLALSNEIPMGSGLGGSSLLVATLLAAIWGYYRGTDYIVNHLNDLINNVLLIEQLMESGGGWQDQIGGLFPGIKLIETAPENPCRYTISYLGKPSKLLDDCSLIIDTRIQRKASRILYSIRQKYVDRDPSTLIMLRTITDNARLGFTMLEQDNLHGFAELLSDSWRMVNEIEYGAVESVEELHRLCGDDLIGMKMGGAGGGGFILAIFEDQGKKDHYLKKIRDRFPSCLIYRPCFGGSGLSVSQNGRVFEVGKIRYV